MERNEERKNKYILNNIQEHRSYFGNNRRRSKRRKFLVKEQHNTTMEK